MTETVLVTGATGFVGSHVARRLYREKFCVRCLSRSGSSRELLQSIPVEWAIGDLRDPSSLQRALINVESIFHVAADYRLWTRRPEDLYESNVVGTRNLLSAAREAGVKRVVYTSTVGALGIPQEGGSGDENTPTSLDQMVGDYKRSKFLAEEVAREFAGAGMDIVIVNPSTPVGPGDIKPTPTGQLIVDFLNGAMPAYLDTGLNLVSVEDVAEGHLLAYRRGRGGERYILGGQNRTLHQILEILADITGLPAPRWRIPYPVALAAGALFTGWAKVSGRPPRVALDSVRMAHVHMFFNPFRAVQELGLPQTPVAIALKDAVRWFLEHGYVTHSARRETACETLQGWGNVSTQVTEDRPL